jgi:hypothetical protein
VHSQGRSLNVRTIIMTESNETVDFKLQFQLWPKNVEVMLYEAGQEKVAGLSSIVALYIKYFHVELGKDHDKVQYNFIVLQFSSIKAMMSQKFLRTQKLINRDSSMC